jgi:hypothetical protein
MSRGAAIDETGRLRITEVSVWWREADMAGQR